MPKTKSNKPQKAKPEKAKPEKKAKQPKLKDQGQGNFLEALVLLFPSGRWLSLLLVFIK